MQYDLSKKSVVEKLTEPGVYLDSKIVGLRLRVYIDRQGRLTRTYKVKVRSSRFDDAVTCTIGNWGQGELTADEAIKRANRYIQQIKDGINPADQKRESKEKKRLIAEDEKRKDDTKALTLRVALDQYLADKNIGQRTKKAKNKLSPQTAALYKQMVTKHLADWLDMPLVSISKDMVREEYKKIAEVTVSSANNAFRVLRAVYNWQIREAAEPVVTSNPVDALLSRWEEVEPRQEIISDTLLKRWWSSLDSLPNANHIDFFRLLLLTGLRKSELGGMRWADVDFENDYWTVRDTKNGRNHSLPFTSMTKEILKRRYSTRLSQEYVFPSSTKAGHIKDLSDPQAAVIESSGVTFYPHMLRKTFATAAALELPPYIVKRFLNHHSKQDVSQSHYVIVEMEQLRAPLQQIEDSLLVKAGVIKRTKATKQGPSYARQ